MPASRRKKLIAINLIGVILAIYEFILMTLGGGIETEISKYKVRQNNILQKLPSLNEPNHLKNIITIQFKDLEIFQIFSVKSKKVIFDILKIFSSFFILNVIILILPEPKIKQIEDR